MKQRSIRVLHTIEVIVVLIAIAIFLLSRESTLKYAADKITSSLNLKYKSIDGNLLTKIDIKELSYKDRVISKEASVNFNLLKLLIMKLDIESLKISKVDMKNLKYFINDISDNSKNETQTSSLPISINIHNISLDLLPYNKDELRIEKLNIFIKDFALTNNFKIDNLKVAIKSNYFDLNYNGSYHDKRLMIKKMDITDLDIQKLLLLKDIIKKDSSSDDTLVKAIMIDEAKLTIKPLKKGHYKISSLSLSLNSLTSDMKLFQAKHIVLKADTNIWKLNSKGYIKDNTFFSDVEVKLDDKYMKKFVPFFNFESLNPVKVALKIDKDKLIGDLNATSKRLLTKDLDKKLNLKIETLTTHAVFDFKTLNLNFHTNSDLSSKYSKKLHLDGDFSYYPKKHISYSGVVTIDKLQNIDTRLKKLLKDTKVEFNGDLKGIVAKANSNLLEAEYDSKDNYLKPKITVISKELELGSLDENLTQKLKDTKLTATIESNLNYKELDKTAINYQINSNLLNIDGEYIPKKGLATSVLSLPQNSIMIDKNISVEKLFPINATLKQLKNSIMIDAKNDNLNLKADYFTKSGDYNLTLLGFQTKVELKQKDKTINYKLHTDSIKELESGINSFYKLPPLNSQGEVTIDGIYKDGVSDFSLSSKWYLIEYAKYKYFFIENTKADGTLSDNRLSINNFLTSAFILDRYRRLFSSQNSTISFDNSVKLNLSLNDKISITGDISDKKSIKISTNNYHLSEPEADIYLNADIDYFSKNSYSSIKGKVELLGGTVMYKPKRSYEVNDKDIIFVGRKKRAKSLLKNQDILVNIISKKQILYRQQKNRIYFTHDITLYKRGKRDLKVQGRVNVISGQYFSDDKRFELGRGELLFGGELLNPYLNLKAYYKKDPYEITIMIGGSLQSPQLNFSSTPYLTQNDILSILLFNTKASSLTDSNSNSNPALSLFGSSFAKGILDSLGVKLDRVSLSTTKEGTLGVELEKRVGRRTTIIYQNDLVQSIKVRYQNSQKVETDLTFSPDSSSIDIIFKNEK